MTDQHPRGDEIASQLSPRQRAVFDGANGGRPLQSIADQFEITLQAVSRIANKLRKRGLHLPYWKQGPRKDLPPKLPDPLRPHADGVSPGGSKITCSADTQKKADDHIAAMVAP